MRSRYFITLLMMSVAVPAFAAGGLHKHDQSIADYNYNIPIQTDDAAGTGNESLATDLDQHEAKDGVTQLPTEASVTPATGGAQNTMSAQPQMSASAPATMTAQNPLAIGAAAPNFQLARASDNQVVTLQNVLANGPALVLFAQGSNGLQQLQLLQKNQNQFRQLGITTIAISSDPIDSINRTTQRFGITYPVLSDAARYVSQQYGVNGTALYSIDAQGKIAAVQTQPNGHGVFDLTEATSPLRATTQQAAAAPAMMASPAAATASPAAMAAAPAAPQQQIQAPAGTQQLAPDRPMPDDMDNGAEAMPPVPSPQAGGKVKFVPPSNPDFGKDLAGLTI